MHAPYTLYTYLNTHTGTRGCLPRFIHVFTDVRARRRGLPGTRVAPPAPLTVAALVLAEPVLAAQQVQGRVQVRVDLVHAIADRLQRHPPVRALRRLLAPRRPPAAGRDRQHQQRWGQQRQPGRGHAEPAKPTPSPRPPARPGPRSAPSPPPWSPRHRPPAGRDRPGLPPHGSGPESSVSLCRVLSAVSLRSALSPLPCGACQTRAATSGVCPVPRQLGAGGAGSPEVPSLVVMLGVKENDPVMFTQGSAFHSIVNSARPGWKAEQNESVPIKR